MNDRLRNKYLSLLLFSIFLIAACDKGQNTVEMPEKKPITSAVAVSEANVDVQPTPAIQSNAQVNDRQLEIGNTRYLFVAAEHTAEELQALLQRVDEITQSEPESHDQLDIALVIHGQNINMFTQKNYEQNKSMIDLAAKLDAFEVIDLKVCEWSMSQQGIQRSEIPSFVESVPFAPDEIKRLTAAGYINL